MRFPPIQEPAKLSFLRQIHSFFKKPQPENTYNIILCENFFPKLHPPERTRMQNPQTKSHGYNNRLTSAARYSRTAAKYTGAPAPTRVANLPALMRRAILPTGNCNPALVLREIAFFPTVLPRDIFAWLQEIHTVRHTTESWSQKWETSDQTSTACILLKNLDKRLADIAKEHWKHWNEADSDTHGEIQKFPIWIEGCKVRRELQQRESNWSRGGLNGSDGECAAPIWTWSVRAHLYPISDGRHGLSIWTVRLLYLDGCDGLLDSEFELDAKESPFEFARRDVQVLGT